MGSGQCNKVPMSVTSTWASFLSSSSFIVLLLCLMVHVAESVPTAEFLVNGGSSGGGRNSDGGEKEMAISGRSLYWSSADSQLEKRSRDVQPIQLCGYRLLEAVRGLCRGNYVGYNRRSDPEMRDERVSMMMMRDAPDDSSPDTTIYKISHPQSNVDDDETELDSMSMMKSKRAKSSKSHLRFRRNIIDECCKKPCSVNEMLRYCGRN